MKQLFNIIKIIILILFFPFTIIFDYFFRKDYRKYFSSSNLVVVVLLLPIWIMFYYLIFKILTPDLLKLFNKQFNSLFLITYGLLVSVHAWSWRKNIKPLDKTNYPKWCVDNWPKEQLWKSIIGRENTIKFITLVENIFNIPLIIAGILFIIIGFYYLLF